MKAQQFSKISDMLSWQHTASFIADLL